jgi:hypothetical protein
MFENYTDKARHVIFFARYEASQLGSPYIEGEHLLLGVLREDKSLAKRFLRSHSDVESIRKQIEQQSSVREETSTSVDLPLSWECKRVLAYATEEAKRLGHKDISSEHLLLGILREQQGLAARILKERGLIVDGVRDELVRTPQLLASPNAVESAPLQDLIKGARRELRRASGVPLTAEEQAEMRRKTEIEEMEMFLFKSFGFRMMLALPSEVIWTDHGATAQMTVDNRRFRLFKDRDGLYSFCVQGGVQRELLKMPGSDPNFANRILVAIDDTLFNTGKPGPG